MIVERLLAVIGAVVVALAAVVTLLSAACRWADKRRYRSPGRRSFAGKWWERKRRTRALRRARSRLVKSQRFHRDIRVEEPRFQAVVAELRDEVEP